MQSIPLSSQYPTYQQQQQPIYVQTPPSAQPIPVAPTIISPPNNPPIQYITLQQTPSAQQPTVSEANIARKINARQKATQLAQHQTEQEHASRVNQKLAFLGGLFLSPILTLFGVKKEGVKVNLGDSFKYGAIGATPWGALFGIFAGMAFSPLIGIGVGVLTVFITGLFSMLFTSINNWINNK